MHTHKHETQDSAPATEGSVIHWAWGYDWLVGALTLGRAGALRRQTVRLAQIQPGERVLEVGCGTGDVALLARAAAGPAGAVVGIDPSPEMIARAQQKAARRRVGIDYRVGVIENLELPSASFDIVLSSLMMHHLPERLKHEGLAEIRRVLKPGGRLLVVDVTPPTTRQGRLMRTLALHGGARTGAKDLPALLRDSGFTRIEAGPIRSQVVSLPLGFVRGWVA
jgi:ubiquinone/menaquinone biosynthesis C-methylase UbiE